MDTDDDGDHPANDSMRYRQYYHATGEEYEEEVDGEADDDQGVYEDDQYENGYGDQYQRAESVGHNRGGRDYREDEDGAIVIESDDEEDGPQVLSGPGLSRISPEWEEEEDAYEDGERTFEEDENAFSQEAVPSNLELEVYDEDPQLDELDDEKHITVDRDEERRDDAVFDSEDQDLMSVRGDEEMAFDEGVPGSFSPLKCANVSPNDPIYRLLCCRLLTL